MNAILMNQRGFVPQANQIAPVLSPMNATQPGALSGNARGSIRMPQIPQNQKIGMNEALMRIGTSGLGQSATGGGLGVYNAMGQTYGNIMDYNRAREMDEFAIQQEQALEQQRRLDLQRKLEQEAKPEIDPEKEQAVAMANAQIETMEIILEGLKKGGLTGFFDGTGQKWLDRLGIADWWSGSDEGSKRAYLRQLLQEFKVDQTLTKVALTKGAISNQEMTLFMSPFPSIALDNEGAWIPQIERRLEIAKKIQAAVAGGSSDVDDLVNQYAP
mgnify:FL=1|tara:strand:+ start:550 stop:1365 length:816 start_codon:yes stop_codon:yes gene_type:complete